MSNTVYAAGLETELRKLRERITDLETEARRYFLSDGSCIVCNTAVEVVGMRVRASRIVESVTSQDFRDAIREWKGELRVTIGREAENHRGRRAQKFFAAIERYEETAKGGI